MSYPDPKFIIVEVTHPGCKLNAYRFMFDSDADFFIKTLRKDSVEVEIVKFEIDQRVSLITEAILHLDSVQYKLAGHERYLN